MTTTPLYTVAQAREQLGGIARPTLYRHMRTGALKYTKIGGRTFFTREQLNDFISAGEVQK